MLYFTVLYCTVLYCTVCTVLCCTVLYCTVPWNCSSNTYRGEALKRSNRRMLNMHWYAVIFFVWFRATATSPFILQSFRPVLTNRAVCNTVHVIDLTLYHNLNLEQWLSCFSVMSLNFSKTGSIRLRWDALQSGSIIDVMKVADLWHSWCFRCNKAFKSHTTRYSPEKIRSLL